MSVAGLEELAPTGIKPFRAQLFIMIELQDPVAPTMTEESGGKTRLIEFIGVDIDNPRPDPAETVVQSRRGTSLIDEGH